MLQQMMPNLLKKRAFLTPSRVAVVFEGRHLTFLELYNESVRMAGKLTSVGIVKGDFVGVLLKNHLDTVIILFSLQLLGVRAVILNNRLTPNELIYQLKDSKTVMLLTEKHFEDKCSEIKKQYSFLYKEELTEMEEYKVVIEDEIDFNDICTIMYTSGTTGNPKGVIQTYGNHWWSATGSSLNLGLREEDCWLCSVPLFHISGFSIIMRSIIYGMKVVLHAAFCEETIIKDIAAEKVTIMSVVSTALWRIVDELKDKSLPVHFRCMLLGGGPAPLPLLKKCMDKEIPVFQTYGMTETASQIVTLSPEDCIRKIGSAGKPLFPAQIKIMADNKEAGPETAGEIILKGPNVTPGYINRHVETAERIVDGWLHTGDIGYIDKEGFLFVLDRRADLIISGGENIYPAEVEGVLMSHPSIHDAGVIGMTDAKWGQVPAAFIVSKTPSLKEEELISFCKSKLASYKIPKKFLFLKEVPRNASNKLLRRELRLYLEETSI